MKVKQYTILMLVLIVVACGKRDNTPPGILKKERMVEVLGELYILEQKVIRLNLPRDSSDWVFTQLKQKLFETTGVSDSVFRKSLTYYLDQPQQLEVVYTTLIDSLNLKEQRVDKKRYDQ